MKPIDERPTAIYCDEAVTVLETRCPNRYEYDGARCVIRLPDGTIERDVPFSLLSFKRELPDNVLPFRALEHCVD
jgi:hypothetical protein